MTVCKCGRRRDSGALGDRCPTCGRDGPVRSAPTRPRAWLRAVRAAATQWAADVELLERTEYSKTRTWP